jgi:hydrogenase-4 component F
VSPLLLVLIPALGVLLLGSRSGRARAPALLLGVATLELLVALVIAFEASDTGYFHGYVMVDPTARLFATVIDLIFFGIAVYVWNRVREAPALETGIERFVALALVFLGAANLALFANHLLLIWILLELTTLTAAPLIVRPGVLSSRRASWHYFLFSSVGLGFALIGFFCLARSLDADGREATFFLNELAARVGGPADPWRKLGLALVFLGFGTKLGLAPMYSWLPEAYDEAPPATTALLAAVQFNCALVGLLRVVQVYRSADPELVSTQLVVIGLASMAVSTVSIIATRNIKRLIAYGSINHAGVIAIGLGVGKAASYGLLLYVVSNAFIKAILFLTVGKIKAHYHTKDTREISGLIKDLPYSGTFLMIGTFALLGFPPFGSFRGELLILSGLVGTGQVLVFAVFCALITISFVATGRTVFPMIWGEPKKKVTWPPQTALAAAPKMVFLAALVAMGIYMPSGVDLLFRQVATSLGGP